MRVLCSRGPGDWGPGDWEIRGGVQGVEGHGALGILCEKFDAIQITSILFRPITIVIFQTFYFVMNFFFTNKNIQISILLFDIKSYNIMVCVICS